MIFNTLKSFILFFFVLSFVFARARAETCSAFKAKDENMNRRLIGHKILEKKLNNHHDCARECFHITKCKSLDFQMRENICKLNDVDSKSVMETEFEPKKGSLFSDITEWPNVMAGACGLKPCSNNQRCIGGKEHYRCIDLECGSVPAVADGKVRLSDSTTTVGSTATVDCNDGFDASKESITCQPSQTWETPNCIIRDCGSVPALANGTVSLSGSTSSFRSTATVSCNDGFDASQELITCQASGFWETPTCIIRDCSSVPAIADGTVSLSDSTTTFGSTATVSCNDGFDASQESITCQASGTWETPNCIIKDCDSVPAIANGTVSLLDSTTTFGSTATVDCNEGFDASQESITCQASGIWETPTCIIKDCDSVPDIANGSVSLSTTTTTFGSTATVSCNDGFVTSQNSITCQASGIWETPTCTRPTDCYEIMKCAPDSASGIYVVKVMDENVQVYCDMETTNGGWTVFQYRFNGNVDFYRNFSEYEYGFGNLESEFWLGLRTVQEMASQNKTELRIDIMAVDGTKAYETFQNFSLDPMPYYNLHIDPGQGTAGDDGCGLSYHNGLPFSTFDADRDPVNFNCAEFSHGGWWYRGCACVNLNGEYVTPETPASGVYFSSFRKKESLKITKMMFRRVE